MSHQASVSRPAIKRAGRIAVLVSVLSMGFGAIVAPAALAAPTPTHGTLNACSAAPQAALYKLAGQALWAKISIHRGERIASFSECLFLSKKGTFVVLDLASSKMLTAHAGYNVSASNEYDFLNRKGKFPRKLQFIGKDHTQFLVAGAWADAQQHDVVGIATFGYYHKVNGHKPAFPKALPRISRFLDAVMANF